MGEKLKFILSDLHLGAGYANEGNYLETFLADKELVQFLDEIRRESEQRQCEVELIINGDFLDFLNVPAVNDFSPSQLYPPEVYLDSSEEASLKRLNLIIDGHAEVFKALTEFMCLKPPQRRMTLIKGDHDVNLYWSGIKNRLRQILDASDSQLVFAEKFVNREKIHIQHGHQLAEKVNRYHDFLDPRRSDNLTQLHYPPIFHLLIDFLQVRGQERWFINNIKPITAMICYALPWNFNFAVKLLLSFINLQSAIFPLDTFLQELADSTICQQMSERYATEKTFRREFHQKILPYLQVTIPAATIETITSTSALSFSNPLAIGQAAQQHQQALLRWAAETVVEQVNAQVVFFGHTHRPNQELLSTGAVYINTGSWTKDCMSVSPQKMDNFFAGTLQQNVSLNRLPFARIDYSDQDNLTAQLLYFTNPNVVL